jgi:hypothetical protein
LICALMVGCVKWSLAAARTMLPCSAVVKK